MQTMQSGGKDKAKELCSWKEMIATSGSDRLFKMETSWRDWWWFDLTVFETSSKFSLVFPPASGGWGGRVGEMRYSYSSYAHEDLL